MEYPAGTTVREYSIYGDLVPTSRLARLDPPVKLGGRLEQPRGQLARLGAAQSPSVVAGVGDRDARCHDPAVVNPAVGKLNRGGVDDHVVVGNAAVGAQHDPVRQGLVGPPVKEGRDAGGQSNAQRGPVCAL